MGAHPVDVEIMIKMRRSENKYQAVANQGQPHDKENNNRVDSHIEARKAGDNVTQCFGGCLLSKLDFAHVERPNPRDGKARVNDGRSPPLGSGQNDIDKTVRIGDLKCKYVQISCVFRKMPS